MSYEPQPPAPPPAPPSAGMPLMPPTQPVPPVAAPPGGAPKAARRRGLVLLGIGVLAAGLAAGAVLFAMRDAITEDTVKKFARAPVGCTTTLEFESAGLFTVYIETKGTADDIGGDCAGNGSSYDRGDDDLPRVTMVLVGPDDEPVALQSSSAYSYDTGSHVGKAVEQVRIEARGTYRLTVTSDDDDFAIAVGKDPEADSSKMVTWGIIAGAAGLLVGGLLLVLGMRRRVVPPIGGAPSAPSWSPVAPAPAPGGPPPLYAPPSYAPPASPPSGPAPEPPGWGAPHP